jgi:hypothetical protein
VISPPVGPMREPARDAVGPELVHHAGRDDLEVQRERVETEAVGQLKDLVDGLLELVGIEIRDPSRPLPGQRSDGIRRPRLRGEEPLQGRVDVLLLGDDHRDEPLVLD